MRILAFAYACEPEKGSEPGAGWAWACMLARLGETWVITRADNRAAVELAAASLPAQVRPRFIFLDLPVWARFWKRGQRGVRAYYLLWQILALLRARRLRSEVGFDLVWHLTFANAWLGSLAPLVGPPFVYGPVGGGVGMTWRLLPAVGWRGFAYELLRATARFVGRYINPLARLAWSRAALILVQNPETLAWLPARHRSRAVLFPNAVLETAVGELGPRGYGSTAFFAGRLLPWKGVSIAIRAIARVPTWRLLVAGAGPDAARLEGLAHKLCVADRVEFLGWLTRDQTLRLLRSEAHLLLFPSLHDDAPWAVTEALSCGVPVLCLDKGGPRVLAGPAGSFVSTSGSFDEVVLQVAHSIQHGVFPAQHTIAARARTFSLEARAEELGRLVDQISSQDPVVAETSSSQ